MEKAFARLRDRSKEPAASDRVPGAAEQTRRVAVRLTNLSKTYPGGHSAVQDVNLAVYEGEFFAILGPSGSGKTSTLRMIGGFETPTSGEIEIGGRLVTDQLPFQRNVNTVFQSYALFPHLDVFGNVAFGLRMKRVPRSERERRVTEIIGMVQLGRLSRRRIGQLSGGEQQRVALARALVNHPAVLLLDEPLGSLDLKLRRDMQRELKSIQERVGITFIHVTHDQDEAMALADRIAVMHDGRILQVGKPQELYERPTDRFIATFFGSTNLFEGVVTRVEQQTIEMDASGVGPIIIEQSLPTRVSASVGDRISVSIRPENVQIDPIGAEPFKPSENSYRGRIAHSIYAGSEISYEVLLEAGRTVDVRVPARTGVRPLLQGDDVEVSWPPAGAVALRD